VAFIRSEPRKEFLKYPSLQNQANESVGMIEIDLMCPGLNKCFMASKVLLGHTSQAQVEAIANRLNDFYESHHESQRTLTWEGPSRGRRALGCTRVDGSSRTSLILTEMKEGQ
jgi:hypothetical protein